MLYELYGLLVDSDVPLPGVFSGSGAPHLRVRRGSDVVRPLAGDGPVLAEASYGGGNGYVLRSVAEGYVLSFHRVCDFVIAADLRLVRVHLHAGADREMVPLLLTGNVLAFVLSLQGRDPLHGSAVEHDRGAAGLLACAGGGKSTLAAFLCSRGARLVTDDVLLLETAGGVTRCHYGGGEVRLRPRSVMLGEVEAPSRTTADGRTAYWLAGPRSGPPPLRRLVVPSLSRTRREARLRRVGAAEAHKILLENAKVGGWASEAALRRRFVDLAGVAAAVPAFVAEIPWGAPLTDELAAALLGAVPGERGIA